MPMRRHSGGAGGVSPPPAQRSDEATSLSDLIAGLADLDASGLRLDELLYDPTQTIESLSSVLAEAAIGGRLPRRLSLFFSRPEPPRRGRKQ